MRWMWIDSIVTYEPDARLVAIRNVTLGEEHLHDHFAADRAPNGAERPAAPIMPGCFLLEGMAQTAGVLVGSVNRFQEKVVLAKIASATLTDDVGPGDTVRYDARIVRIDAGGAVTEGTVEVRRAGRDTWDALGSIELMFSHLDQNMGGVTFPEENFVFSDNFRMILRAAGLDELASA